MHIESFYHQDSSTWTHVVVDQSTQKCAVIDPVLDYDQDAARYSTESADQVIDYIQNKDLTVAYLLETHIHADHISACHYLKQQLGGKTGIGSGILSVLAHWVPVFESAHDTATDGSQFDHIFGPGDTFNIGQLKAQVIHTPGHTPACVSYHIESAVFVGDTLFSPDGGTARVDFPGGNAEQLYQSIQKLYALPDETVMYLCHDYPAEGQSPCKSFTVAEQKKHNKMIKAETTLAEYTQLRQQRDASLAVPRLILPSIQTNMRLGGFGAVSEQGTQFIKIPINKL
ncbi:MAG: MBL fold metallo-hydrolase [Proteobacteria bacterium]|nr:MAG: MBL fold metallo-hydrolase [Pseudomonadota bacterium]